MWASLVSRLPGGTQLLKTLWPILLGIFLVGIGQHYLSLIRENALLKSELAVANRSLYQEREVAIDRIDWNEQLTIRWEVYNGSYVPSLDDWLNSPIPDEQRERMQLFQEGNEVHPSSSRIFNRVQAR